MIQVFDDAEAMAHAAAALFTQCAQETVQARGRLAVALSGGHTPKRTYELLGSELYRDQLPWHAVHIFWGDERCVPADNAKSNQRMARHALLDLVPIPPANIHAIDGTLSPEAAAEQYESELREFARGNAGFLDLVFLGLGEDGHTASLFPGSPALNASDRWVLAVAPTETRIARITLTPLLLNHARQVVFLVSGSNKADVLRRVVEDRDEELPAFWIRPSVGEVQWLAGRAAVGDLSGRDSKI